MSLTTAERARLLSVQRAQELVLYDFLGRLYESQAARAGVLTQRAEEGTAAARAPACAGG